MKILVLGDIMGLSGRDVLKRKLPKIIKDNKIDFSIINGENAADDELLKNSRRYFIT